MEIKELIENIDRNYKVEKNVINEIGNVLSPFINEKDIKKVLEDNGFNGIYIIPEHLYNKVTDNMNADGFYSVIFKTIIIKEKQYFKNKEIVKHELCHAYLDNKIVRKLYLEGTVNFYGSGIEEGIASVFQSVNSYKNIGSVKPQAYNLQASLFQQLNHLYNYTSFNEYPNLLIHLLKEPEYFLTLIKDIYYEILQKNIGEFDKNLPGRSALRLITGADLYIEKKPDRLLYDFIHSMNSLYLTIADEDFLRGESANNLFKISPRFICSAEKLLIYKIFGSMNKIREEQLSNLNFLHFTIDHLLSQVENSNIVEPKVKTLIR